MIIFCAAFYINSVTFDVEKLPHREKYEKDGLKYEFYVDEHYSKEASNWATIENNRGHRLTVDMKCQRINR